MTMISKKDFTSSNYRLFMLPAFTRAFLFKSSPLGELSYNIKKEVATVTCTTSQDIPIFSYGLIQSF